jgi:hypothetical protein
MASRILHSVPVVVVAAVIRPICVVLVL